MNAIAVAFMFLAAGCASDASRSAESAHPQRYVSPPPSDAERYCAWYGEAGASVLYFGTSAFWSAMADANNDPRGDLKLTGPAQIGRFDLERERLLPPLEVSRPGDEWRSGVWDVLPHPNGRVYFSSLYDRLGFADPESGEVAHFDHLGAGSNELALGPDGAIVATRYGGYRGGAGGSLVVFDPDGALLAEHGLGGDERSGGHIAPKTVAYDPLRREYWVTTDLLVPRSDGAAAESLPGAPGHPTLVLDERGRELARIASSEIHFVRFDASGRGAAVFVAEGELRLRWLETQRSESPELLFRAGSGSLLDEALPSLDFAQDLSFAADGSALATRWSGRIHRVARSGDTSELQLPHFESGGLYYSSAIFGERSCTTYCADVSVVCAPAP